MTDSLLGIIENSATYKVALGFDKGDVGAVSSGGKKVIEQYQSIARKLFIEVKNSVWSDTKDNMKSLGESVKNRVVSYVYGMHCIILTNLSPGSRKATSSIGPASRRRVKAFSMQVGKMKSSREARLQTSGVSLCAGFINSLFKYLFTCRASTSKVPVVHADARTLGR